MSDRSARAIKLNVINEPKDSYTGGKSTLCPGCARTNFKRYYQRSMGKWN